MYAALYIPSPLAFTVSEIRPSLCVSIAPLGVYDEDSQWLVQVNRLQKLIDRLEQKVSLLHFDLSASRLLYFPSFWYLINRSPDTMLALWNWHISKINHNLQHCRFTNIKYRNMHMQCVQCMGNISCAHTHTHWILPLHLTWCFWVWNTVWTHFCFTFLNFLYSCLKLVYHFYNLILVLFFIVLSFSKLN